MPVFVNPKRTLKEEAVGTRITNMLAALALELLYPGGDPLRPNDPDTEGLESYPSESMDWALMDKSVDGDIFARIASHVGKALGFESAALVAQSRAGHHHVAAYRNLPRELLQILTEHRKGWMGLDREMQSMQPALLRLEDSGPSPYRTAMALFGFKLLAVIPFHASAQQKAALLLMHRDAVALLPNTEAELQMHEHLDLAQRQVQMVMEHIEQRSQVNQSAQRMYAVREGLRRLTSTSHPDQIWQKTCHQLRRIFSCTVAWLAVNDSPHDTRISLRPIAVSGAPTKLLEALDLGHTSAALEKIRAARDARMLSKSTSTAADFIKPEQLKEAAETPNHPLRHVVYPDAMLKTIIAPVFSNQNMVGAIALHRDRPFELGDADWDVLWIFADQVALALRSARLINEAEERSERLAASEGLYRSFVEQLNDGVVRLNVQGHIQGLNTCAAQMFGRTADELRGAPLLEHVAPSDTEPLNQAIQDALEGKSQDLTLKLHRSDNRQMVVVMRLGPLKVNDEVAGVIGVARDDSERLAIQRKLLVREKLASVGMLSAGVAHEINNPLAFIISNLTSLDEDTALGTDERLFNPNERSEMMRECLEGAERIRAIISNLREFAQRSDHDEHNPTELNPLIRPTAWLVVPKAHYSGQIALELSEDLPSILCSPGQIAQLLVQLLLNALQSIPTNRTHSPGAVVVRTRQQSPTTVTIEIEDVGTGIARRDMMLIFEPFFSTQAPSAGTGLGLVMCLEIIQRHHGQITIDSWPDKGTTVTVELPVHPEKTPMADPGFILHHQGKPIAP